MSLPDLPKKRTEHTLPYCAYKYTDNKDINIVVYFHLRWQTYKTKN